MYVNMLLEHSGGLAHLCTCFYRDRPRVHVRLHSLLTLAPSLIFSLGQHGSFFCLRASQSLCGSDYVSLHTLSPSLPVLFCVCSTPSHLFLHCVLSQVQLRHVPPREDINPKDYTKLALWSDSLMKCLCWIEELRSSCWLTGL